MVKTNKVGPIARARLAIARLVAPASPTHVGRSTLFNPSSGKAAWRLADWDAQSGDPYGPGAIDALYRNYALEGYSSNALIYAAIKYKVRAAYYAPLRAYRGDAEHPELALDHPLTDMLQRPNPYQSWAEFMGLNVVFLNVSGNSFILVARNEAGDPVALYPLRPDRVSIIARDVIKRADGQVIEPREVLGYLYEPDMAARSFGGSEQEALPIPASDIIHTLEPNPLDPLQGMGSGMSPVRPMAKSGDVDNKVTDFLKLFFDHGAMFSGVLRAPDVLSDDIVARIRAQFMELYGSYKQWSKVAVLDADLQYERIGMSFDEMGFEGIDRRNASRILMVFGVPPALISEPYAMDRATYNNIQELRRIFWEDTFKPELWAYQDQFQFALNNPDDDVFVAFDFSQVPALSRDVPSLVSAAKEMWAMGAPASIAYKTVGLSVEDYAGSDIGYIPVTLVPSSGEQRSSPDGVTRAVGDEEDVAAGLVQEEAPENVASTAGLNGAQINAALQILERLQADTIANVVATELLIALGLTTERASRIVQGVSSDAGEEMALVQKQVQNERNIRNQEAARAISRNMDDWEARFADEATQRFDDDLRAMLARLRKALREAYAHKATVSYSNILLDWRQYLDMAGEQWREAFVPLISGVVQAQVETWSMTFGIEFDVRNLFAEAWFQDYVLEFAQPIMDTTEKDLSALLEQAEREGWSIPEIEKRLKLVFRQYMRGDLTAEEFEWFEARMPRYRRELIARTEVLRASNAGSYHLFRAWGAPMKEWLATADARTRETHLGAWAKYSEGGEIGPIPIDEPFIVGGYRMMFPGDTSLGAGLNEVCNCRCTVLPYGEFVNV